MKRILLAFMFVFLGVIVSGCGPSIDLNDPPEILYGEDVCDQCNMIISEARYAAAYYTEDGTARLFDDIGGMCIYHNNNNESVAKFWVHDYETEEWLEAQSAYYVVSEDLYTPMSFGVIAFSENESANNMAAESQGMVMTFDEVMDYFVGMDTDMGEMDGMDDMDGMDGMN